VIDADAIDETVRIALPPEFKVDELPDRVHADSPFGRYEASWVVEQNTLVFKRKLELQAQSVPADRYPELKRFLDLVGSSPEQPVVLMKSLP
jgi:hypothetical protein